MTASVGLRTAEQERHPPDVANEEQVDGEDCPGAGYQGRRSHQPPVRATITIWAPRRYVRGTWGHGEGNVRSELQLANTRVFEWSVKIRECTAGWRQSRRQLAMMARAVRSKQRGIPKSPSEGPVQLPSTGRTNRNVEANGNWDAGILGHMSRDSANLSVAVGAAPDVEEWVEMTSIASGTFAAASIPSL